MKKTYMLEGLDCANCAAKIERLVGELDGVTSAFVSFLTTKMVLEVEDDKVAAVEKAAAKLIKKVEPDTHMKAM